MSSDKKATKPAATAAAASKNAKSQEKIYADFQTLRNEQRAMASKLTEMEGELNEHKIVIDTLKNVDPKRKCYRMVGGILCERTVGEVMPALVLNSEQLTKVIETLNEQLTQKGVEINEYKEKYQIRIRGQDDVEQPTESKDKDTKRSAVVVNPIQV